jgi:hypothetical protein
MTSAARLDNAAAPRILVLDDDRSLDVFDVIGIADGVARVRCPFMFEVGEELVVRIEHGGVVSEAIARVRAHVGPAEARITELELSERSNRASSEGS